MILLKWDEHSCMDLTVPQIIFCSTIWQICVCFFFSAWCLSSILLSGFNSIVRLQEWVYLPLLCLIPAESVYLPLVSVCFQVITWRGREKRREHLFFKSIRPGAFGGTAQMNTNSFGAQMQANRACICHKSSQTATTMKATDACLMSSLPCICNYPFLDTNVYNGDRTFQWQILTHQPGIWGRL